jgi:hypothetical protein
MAATESFTQTLSRRLLERLAGSRATERDNWWRIRVLNVSPNLWIDTVARNLNVLEDYFRWVESTALSVFSFLNSRITNQAEAAFYVSLSQGNSPSKSRAASFLHTVQISSTEVRSNPITHTPHTLMHQYRHRHCPYLPPTNQRRFPTTSRRNPSSTPGLPQPWTRALASHSGCSSCARWECHCKTHSSGRGKMSCRRWW